MYVAKTMEGGFTIRHFLLGHREKLDFNVILDRILI